MEFTLIEQISVIFGIVGSIFGIVGTTYGIKKKRELTRSQLKTEQTKRSVYRSKKKAADAQTAESQTNSLKNLWDLFRGK